MNLTWIQTDATHWRAEGAAGWQAHVEKSEQVYVAWVEREPTGPLDDDCAEAASDWYYTLAGAQAWCVDRLTGRSPGAAADDA